MKNILTKFGVLDITENMIISYNYDYIVGYKLNSKSLFLKSKSDQESYYILVERFINSLSDDISSIQFIIKQQTNNKSILSLYNTFKDQTKNEIKRHLLNDAYSHFDDLETRSIDIYVFICIENGYKKPKTTFFKTPLVGAMMPKLVLEDTILKIESQLISSLKALQISIARLDTSQLFQFCFDISNPGTQRDVKKRECSEYQDQYSVREQLLLENYGHTADYLKIGDVFVTTLHMTLLPISADLYFLDDFLNGINGNYIGSLIIKPVNKKDAIKKMFLTKQFEKYPLFSQESAMSVMEQHEKRSIVDEKEDAIQKVSSGQSRLYDISFHISIEDQNEQNLLNRSKEITNHYYEHANYLTVTPTNYDQLESYLIHIPSHSHFSKLNHWILSEQLSFFLPFSGTFKGTQTQQMIFKTHDRELVPFSLDHNGLPASHGLVIGSTGSGKSFFMNWLIKNMLIQTDTTYHVTIIDMGGSYEKLCRLFDGIYIKVDISEDYAIQLFPDKSFIFVNDKINNDLIVFISQMISIMIGESDELTPFQEQLLLSSIVEFYKTVDEPLLIHYQQFLSNYPTKEKEEIIFYTKVVQNLSLYTEPNAAYSCLFNSRGSIDFSNEFIVFDITKLKAHPRLQGIYIHLISNVCKLKMYQSEKLNIKQLLIRDEVWSILKEDVHRNIVEEEYRTARKYGTHTLSVSNSVQDFLGNPCVDAIRRNSHLIYALPMKQDDAQLLEHYGFNENEIQACQSLHQESKRYSQVFVKMGDIDSFVIHLSPSKFEYQLCSKDFESNQLYKDLETYTSKELFNILCENAS